jgi:hypothetical protein
LDKPASHISDTHYSLIERHHVVATVFSSSNRSVQLPYLDPQHKLLDAGFRSRCYSSTVDIAPSYVHDGSKGSIVIAYHSNQSRSNSYFLCRCDADPSSTVAIYLQLVLSYKQIHLERGITRNWLSSRSHNNF